MRRGNGHIQYTRLDWSRTVKDQIQIKSRETGFLRLQVDFTSLSIPDAEYSSNITALNQVQRKNKVFRFCLTKNTRLNYVYLDTTVQSAWQGYILIRRKFNSGQKEEEILVKCDSGCTGSNQFSKMFIFGDGTADLGEDNEYTVCTVGSICRISSTEKVSQTTETTTMTMPEAITTTADSDINTTDFTVSPLSIYSRIRLYS